MVLHRAALELDPGNLQSSLGLGLAFSNSGKDQDAIDIFKAALKNNNEDSFLNFNLVWNNGIAFGLFSYDQNIYYNVITSVIISVTLVIIWITFKSKGLEKISYLMIIGGSFGNIFDRLYYSSVIDFIDISYNNFHWFIFNVADIFISLGVILLIALEFLKNEKKK